MSIKLSAKLSTGLQVTIEAENQKDAIKQLAFFSELPSCCPQCQGELKFTYRNVDDNEYFGFKCKKQGHETSFGQHKSGGGLFYKSGMVWTIYKKDENKPEETKSDEVKKPST